jgi:hypothetical protein
MENTLRKAWYSPAFSTLLSNRAEGLVLVIVAGLQLGLHLFGLPAWACPFKAVFGIPCPGCGMTAAIGELLHGRVREAWNTHPFAPIFFVAFLILLVSILLPRPLQTKLAEAFARLEMRTGIAAWVLSALMLYWVVRLLGFV